MSTARTARPIGSFLVAPTRGETLDRYSPSIPGPLGYACGDAWERPDSAGHVGNRHALHTWLPFDLDTLPTEQSLPARARGSIRIASSSESDASYGHVRVPTRHRANEVAARLIDDSAARSLLRQISMRGAAAQVSWVAEQLLSGRLIVLWRLREPPIRPPAAAPMRPPAPTPRAIPTAAAAAPDSTFPPDLDAAVMAQCLKDAAADAMPFCEECAKERAHRGAATGSA